MVGTPVGGAAGLAGGLEPFKQLIKGHCGLQFEGDDATRLAQALHERCTHHAVALPAYLALVQRSASELQELVNLLTINETYFFRESAQIDWLVQHLAPRLLARSQGAWPIRILSAACSTGEEPYSIALALWQKYGDHAARWLRCWAAISTATPWPVPVQPCIPIFLSEAYLSKCASATSPAQPRAGSGPARARDGGFSRVNLLAPAHDGALQDCDVVFCRNVSIYFDTPTRRTIQQGLAALLRDEGVLVIGLAETLANDLGVLPWWKMPGCFISPKGRWTGHCTKPPSPRTPALLRWCCALLPPSPHRLSHLHRRPR